MTAEVHQIGDARKAKMEAGETMHYVGPSTIWRNSDCAHCRLCTICGETACNRVVEGKVGGSHGHIWTDDLETWSKHTNPCKSIPILGDVS